MTMKKTGSIKLTNSKGMEVEVLTLGAVLKSIKTPDKEGNLENILIEYLDSNTYRENPGYLNAIIGRTAGRIHKAEFTIKDKTHTLAQNEKTNAIHGGIQGFDKKNWSSEDVSAGNISAVALSCFSSDGEEGYPGNLEVKVTYSLDEENRLTLDYEAVSDADTLVNLTNHAYFNLSGDAKRSIEGLELMINANQVCELDEENIVTGKLLDVTEHTPFDFRTPKAVGQDISQDHYQLNTRKGYDHPWILEGEQVAASLYDPISGRQLEVSTDQKTVVVYSMNGGNSSSYINGKKEGGRHGITFETQSAPIGHNQCFKEDSLVRANEKYTQKTSFKFTTR